MAPAKPHKAKVIMSAGCCQCIPQLTRLVVIAARLLGSSAEFSSESLTLTGEDNSSRDRDIRLFRPMLASLMSSFRELKGFIELVEDMSVAVERLVNWCEQIVRFEVARCAISICEGESIHVNMEQARTCWRITRTNKRGYVDLCKDMTLLPERRMIS
jgi:hypothetical protein